MDGFIKAVYTFQTVFPLGKEISRYKQHKQLEASCVLRDEPCCFSALKRAKSQESDKGDCHHFVTPSQDFKGYRLKKKK